MIPKDILENLYLKSFHAEIKKEVGQSTSTGRTVRLLLADRPQGQRGPSAWLVGRRCVSGRSGSNNGPSAPGDRTVRAPRGPSAGVSRTAARVARRWVPGRGMKSIQPLLSFLHRTSSPPSPFFLPYLKEKSSLLGILIRALPRPSEHIPGLSASFSTMSFGYFFESLCLSLGF
jgi:hypothetical protein